MKKGRFEWKAVIASRVRDQWTKLRRSRKRQVVLAAVFVAVVLIITIAVLLTRPSAQNTSLVYRDYVARLASLKANAESHPNDADARQQYAQALYVTGNKNDSRDQYIAAIRLRPNDATLYNNLGNVERDLGNYDAAITAYRKAISLNPTSQNAYVNLANLQIYTLNKPADGIETYKLALTKLGHNTQFELLLALAYERNNQTDLAVAMYHQILHEEPTNQAAKDNLTRLGKK